MQKLPQWQNELWMYDLPEDFVVYEVGRVGGANAGGTHLYFKGARFGLSTRGPLKVSSLTRRKFRIQMRRTMLNVISCAQYTVHMILKWTMKILNALKALKSGSVALKSVVTSIMTVTATQ